MNTHHQFTRFSTLLLLAIFMASCPTLFKSDQDQKNKNGSAKTKNNAQQTGNPPKEDATSLASTESRKQSTNSGSHRSNDGDGKSKTTGKRSSEKLSFSSEQKSEEVSSLGKSSEVEKITQPASGPPPGLLKRSGKNTAPPGLGPKNIENLPTEEGDIRCSTWGGKRDTPEEITLQEKIKPKIDPKSEDLICVLGPIADFQDLGGIEEFRAHITLSNGQEESQHEMKIEQDFVQNTAMACCVVKAQKLKQAGVFDKGKCIIKKIYVATANEENRGEITGDFLVKIPNKAEPIAKLANMPTHFDEQGNLIFSLGSASQFDDATDGLTLQFCLTKEDKNEFPAPQTCEVREENGALCATLPREEIIKASLAGKQIFAQGFRLYKNKKMIASAGNKKKKRIIPFSGIALESARGSFNREGELIVTLHTKEDTLYNLTESLSLVVNAEIIIFKSDKSNNNKPEKVIVQSKKVQSKVEREINKKNVFFKLNPADIKDKDAKGLFAEKGRVEIKNIAIYALREDAVIKLSSNALDVSSITVDGDVRKPSDLTITVTKADKDNEWLVAIKSKEFVNAEKVKLFVQEEDESSSKKNKRAFKRKKKKRENLTRVGNINLAANEVQQIGLSYKVFFANNEHEFILPLSTSNGAAPIVTACYDGDKKMIGTNAFFTAED